MLRIRTPGTLLVNVSARLLFPGTCTTFRRLVAILVLAAIDTSFGCASLFLVLFGSPFLLPTWSRILPLPADQVLDLATVIVLPSPRRNTRFRLWKEVC